MTGLRAAGASGVPEHLGLDDQGEGDVPVYPMQSWVWDEGDLEHVRSLLT